MLDGTHFMSLFVCQKLGAGGLVWGSLEGALWVKSQNYLPDPPVPTPMTTASTTSVTTTSSLPIIMEDESPSPVPCSATDEFLNLSQDTHSEHFDSPTWQFWTYIPEGCVLVGPRNARFFTFSDSLLTILHAIYLVSDKVASNRAKITVFSHISYIYLRTSHPSSQKFELLKIVLPGKWEKCQRPGKPF